jgi:molybdate transport system substrate-binding protein
MTSSPHAIPSRQAEQALPVRDRHVFSNTPGQWLGAGVVWALLFAAAFGYHLARNNPVIWFTANKCFGIGAVLAIACALAIGPLNRLSKQRLAGLLPWRRSLGVMGAVAAVPHVVLSLVAFPEKFPLAWYAEHWISIVAAALGVAVLAVLVVYSWPRGYRQLGPTWWLRLHKLSWLALGLVLAHVLLLGKVPGWIKWFQTFDKPLPPGAFATAVLVSLAFLMKGLDMALGRTRLTLLVAAVVLAGANGCSKSPPPPEFRVLCGSSMSPPLEEIQPWFEKEHGPVAVDLGGSETLLPRVLAGTSADVFICHDPFEEKVREAGFLSNSVAVGVLRPVLLVSPGNPKKIQSVSDLSREGLKLGIGNPSYSTCGEMFVGLLKKKGIENAVMRNVVMQARSHGELANGLIVGSLDAIVVWNFIARLHKEKVELVPTNDEYPAVRVTVLGLNQSPNPKLRDAFLDFCRSKPVQEVFQKHGYTARD